MFPSIVHILYVHRNRLCTQGLLSFLFIALSVLAQGITKVRPTTLVVSLEGEAKVYNIKDDFEVTHINLNDQTIAGIRSVSNKAFSVQYHPEAALGPHDSHYLFNEFAHLMSHNQFSDQTGSTSDSNEDLKKKEVNVV